MSARSRGGSPGSEASLAPRVVDHLERGNPAPQTRAASSSAGEQRVPTLRVGAQILRTTVAIVRANFIDFAPLDWLARCMR